MNKHIDWEAAEEGLRLACEAAGFDRSHEQDVLVEHSFAYSEMLILRYDQTGGGVNAELCERDLFQYVPREERTLP